MPLNPHVRTARDFLLLHREDHDCAAQGFSWPELPLYNFATDWFDGLAEDHPDQTALWVIDAVAGGAEPETPEPETRLSFAELAARSVAVAHFLADLGLRRGDRLLLVVGNCVPLWEVMLGAIRLGAVVIPATTQLSPADLADRVARGDAKLLVAHGADAAKFAAIELPLGKVAVDTSPTAVQYGDWVDYARSADFAGREPKLPGVTRATDPMLLYFTSGTTALPKLVQHSHVSYPIGHLSTMYWLGLRPGDIHLNVSSPGWAKHAWSNIFAPWLAGATVLVYNYARFDPARLLAAVARAGVTTFLRPADRVAEARPDRPRRLPHLHPGGPVGRGTAPPRGDRAGTPRLGSDRA